MADNQPLENLTRRELIGLVRLQRDEIMAALAGQENAQEKLRVYRNQDRAAGWAFWLFGFGVAALAGLAGLRILGVV